MKKENQFFILTRLYVYIFILVEFIFHDLNYKYIFFLLSILLICYEILDTYANIKRLK